MPASRMWLGFARHMVVVIWWRFHWVGWWEYLRWKALERTTNSKGFPEIFPSTSEIMVAKDGQYDCWWFTMQWWFVGWWWSWQMETQHGWTTYCGSSIQVIELLKWRWWRWCPIKQQGSTSWNCQKVSPFKLTKSCEIQSLLAVISHNG